MKTMNSSRLETDLALYIQVEVEAASSVRSSYILNESIIATFEVKLTIKMYMI